MWHDIVITAHAVTGGVALLAGCVTLVRRGWFRTYLFSLAGMEAFLLIAIGLDWGAIGSGTRVVFIALAALGAGMLAKAELARRCRPTTGPPSSRHVQHVGFTLVGLVDAFIVVLVLNAGAAAWLVTASGVAIAVAGHFGIRSAELRLATEAATGPTTRLPSRK